MEILRFERSQLLGIVKLCTQEGWPTFPSDHERALRALTAPGVVTIVAVDAAQVIGFAQLQTDGAIQAHLSLIAVSEEHRRKGIGRKLIEMAFALSGAERIDLITETPSEFYESFAHRSMSGCRIYPSSKSN
jgi:ribosomal protein S18 acetylase RimI-like enzyme